MSLGSLLPFGKALRAYTVQVQIPALPLSLGTLASSTINLYVPQCLISKIQVTMTPDRPIGIQNIVSDT